MVSSPLSRTPTLIGFIRFRTATRTGSERVSREADTPLLGRALGVLVVAVVFPV